MNAKYITIFLVLALAIVACNSQAPTPTPPTTEQQPAAQPVAATDAPAAAPTEQSSATKALTDIFGMQGKLQWKIAYNVDTQASGQKVSSKMTQYIKGQGKVRVDMDTQGIAVESFIVDGTVTSCTKMNDAWNCYKTAVKDTQKSAQDTQKDIAKNPADWTIAEDGTMEVAGVTAKCYKTVSTKQGYTARYCYSPEYAPVYMKVEAKDYTSEMIATSFSKSVSDSDFTPPAEAKELAAMTGPTGAPKGSAGGDPCAACEQVPSQYRDQCLKSCGK